MKQIFDNLSFDLSKATTKKYSTSFSLGISTLSPEIRPAIYAIYGFVRFADEIVDSFHDFDKSDLLNRFKQDTILAIEQKISLNPILNSLQATYHRYNIDWELVETFLNSMEMDLEKISYNDEKYNLYILGSAEVVGLMCLKVFVSGDQSKYEELKPYAMKLGSAFQKINFLRDLKDDFQGLGRVYFPNVDMENFNTETKKRIEEEIEKEFNEALTGIKKLPSTSRLGVYLAYKYYKSLLNKIKNTPHNVLAQKRIRINDGYKLSLMMSSYIRVQMSML